MSPGEIAWRLQAGLGDGLARVGERFSPPVRRKLAKEQLAASFLQADTPQLFVPLCKRDPEDERRLLAGELRVFGRWVAVGTDASFWHTDPLFGTEWPRLPYRQIDYRPGNKTGDVRIVWELNRLQHLFSLAMIAHQEPALRQAAVQRFEADLQTWHAANPPGTGVNYLSAMEEALRLVSLFHAYDLIRQWASPGSRAILAGIVAYHAPHMQRRLSLYSSAGNHTIAEATGLLYAGVLLPEYPGAAGWRETGRRLLRAEAARQIDADGCGIEQATWYQLFITDLLGLAQALLRHCGKEPEPAVDAALERSRRFLNTLASGPDDLPRIGDADDGYALSPALRISWATTGVDLPLQCSLPTAGLSLSRQSADERLVFLHNPLGMSPGFGHGHADCLSLIFRFSGVDLLIDPGTGGYGGAADYRSYFRSAAGHNTATVDGLDQAEQAGAFLWTRPYLSKVLINRCDADGVYWLAQHDGFRGQGVTHYRGVIYRPGRFLAVWDHFDGAAGHAVNLRWHLGCPVATHDLSAGRVEFQAGDRAALLEISGGVASLIEGQTSPLLGWRSPRYGSIEPCSVLAVRADSTAPCRVLTVLWLGEPASLASIDPLLLEFVTHIKS
jgi:hypothetical protein